MSFWWNTLFRDSASILQMVTDMVIVCNLSWGFGVVERFTDCLMSLNFNGSEFGISEIRLTNFCLHSMSQPIYEHWSISLVCLHCNILTLSYQTLLFVYISSRYSYSLLLQNRPVYLASLTVCLYSLSVPIICAQNMKI